jgi:hypothetical protein
MLAGGNGETLLANFPAENSQALIKSYITELINRYAQDDTRDRAVMRRLQQTVIDGRGVADLAQLITVANGIIKGQNEMREPEEEPQPLLDRQSMFSVGDALLIVLEQTRPLSATDDEWSALFEQDVQHAEIIDTLHVLTRKDRSEAMRLTSVFLRYPLASDQTIVDIRGQLTTGAAPATVRVQRGSRDKADRTVSIWRLKYRRSGGLLT